MSSLFFFNDTATTEIYTLSLHDALPILHRPGVLRRGHRRRRQAGGRQRPLGVQARRLAQVRQHRSEEHTSELQSRQYLVCRLLLEKKTNNILSSLFHLIITIDIANYRT